MPKRPHNSTFHYCGIFCILIMILAGCKRSQPVATPTPIGVKPARTETLTPNFPVALLSPSPVLPVNTLQAFTVTQTRLPSTALAFESQIGTASPSATPCALPGGWVVYTIQLGDTLGWLAEQTKSTVGKLKEANCLESDLIIAYETIFLPRRPPVQAAAVPGPAPVRPGGEAGKAQAPIVDCTAMLSCVIQAAEPEFWSGAPGYTTPPPPGPNRKIFEGGTEYPTYRFNPCDPKKNVHIDVYDQAGQSIPLKQGHPIQQGERAFIFICVPSDSGELSATALTYSGQRYPLKIYAYNPVGYLPMGDAQLVIDFPARPDMPTGKYYMLVQGGAYFYYLENIFTIVAPDANKSYVLPNPLVGYPGDTFNIYYVNYPSNTTIRAMLYSANPPGVQPSTDMIARLSWPVTIDNPLILDGTRADDKQPGWSMAQLTFPAGAPINTYAIADQDLAGVSLLWIK